MARKRYLFLPYLESVLRLALLFLGALLFTLAMPTLAKDSASLTMPIASSPITVQADAEQTAQQLFEAGRYQEAIVALQQLLSKYQQEGNRVEQAIVLSNLSLSYQKLGNWEGASQSVEEALTLLNGQSAVAVRAQVLDVRGTLELARGQAEKAVDTWAEATHLYQQVGDLNRAAMSQINQSQALQQLGLFRRAIVTLSGLETLLSNQPDSLTKATTLRTLSDALRAAGDLKHAQEMAQQSQLLATRLQSPEAIALANLSLGNLAMAQGQVNLEADNPKQARLNFKAAIAAYETAANPTAPELIRAQAKLNQLNLLLKTPAKVRPLSDPWTEIQKLQSQIREFIPTLPAGRTAVNFQISFAHSLIRWRQFHPDNAPDSMEIARRLATAVQQAKQLNDPRAIATATGYLGRVYEKVGQWPDAYHLTQAALVLAQANQAADLAYRWQWQLGRILKAQGQNQAAIAAYTEAFTTMQSLKRDLTASTSDVQFSFREEAEPVYRQLVDLLLQTPTPDNLRQARAVLESLQIAELQNFLQSACQDTSLQVDQIVDRTDSTAAVIYPIILDDRLEVVLKLPGQADLYHYPPIQIPRQQIVATLQDFQESLQEPYRFKAAQANGQKIYNWLIQPVQEQLEKQGIKTLIFALDGPLRTIPMAALHDGQQYLVERYAVSLVLGLDVRAPMPLHRNQLRVLAASLTNPPPGFTQYDVLANVNSELDEIQASGVQTMLIRDQAFTRSQFNQQLNQGSFQVIHLATHGQFGKDRNQTYILAADGAIRVDELDQLFRTQKQNRSSTLELLILSACKTAAGDDRAVLGIAGTAVKAGAQSAIAGLWTLADEPSVKFTRTLYRFLGEPNITRAEALRRAQVALLQDSEFSHPRYWAPYVLVGSWL